MRQELLTQSQIRQDLTVDLKGQALNLRLLWVTHGNES